MSRPVHHQLLESMRNGVTVPTPFGCILRDRWIGARLIFKRDMLQDNACAVRASPYGGDRYVRVGICYRSAESRELTFTTDEVANDLGAVALLILRLARDPELQPPQEVMPGTKEYAWSPEAVWNAARQKHAISSRWVAEFAPWALPQ